MENSKEYLRSKSCITNGDVVFIDIIHLMNYTKLVQLESLLDFVEINEPESYGLINSLKFEIRSIMKEIENSKEPTGLNY